MLGGCAGLPSQQGRDASYSLSAAEAARTSIAHNLSPVLAQYPAEQSGVYPLIEADDAFAARMLMARHAERTLDVQYYIWRADMTGLMLLEALHAAADRGVRVRLLLDDNNIAPLEPFLVSLNAHPKIEVRLFNPFTIRHTRWLNFVTDFSRANRRMHNKSFTMDSSVTIVGGRNVGDEYFGAADDVLFADLDVLTVGAVVQDVARDFDGYWNSVAAYPFERIVSARYNGVTLAQLAERAEAIARNPAASEYLESLRESDLLARLFNRQLRFEWARVRMVSDDPAKVLRKHREDAMVINQLQAIIGNPQVDVELISPYFVPTVGGVEAFAWLVDQGVEVKVLTNSLAATDVAAVHAGYAKRRKALLEAGVELYEMRSVVPRAEKKKNKKESKKEGKKGRFLGSSGSSLHAKTFSIDRKHVFVGSFNFDPRSANLNTELGFVIESEDLAERINRAFYEEIPEQAYQVKLHPDGYIYWQSTEDGVQKTFRTEPDSSGWQRLGVRALSWLPIEGLL